jgi:hypothetical protein
MVIENDDMAAVSICKITAAPTSEAGKYEYFQALGTPSKIRVLVVLHGRLLEDLTVRCSALTTGAKAFMLARAFSFGIARACAAVGA